MRLLRKGACAPVLAAAFVLAAPVFGQGGSAASEPDEEVVRELVRLGIASQGSSLPKEEALMRQARRTWEDMPEETRELVLRRVAWARENLDEGDGSPLLTDRGVALLVMGPPTRIHHEERHAWSDGDLLELDGPVEVARELGRALRGEAGGSGGSAPGNVVGGVPDFLKKPAGGGGLETPARIWVHPIPEDPSRVRVLWFADRRGDGSFELVRHELLEVTERISEAPARSLPAELFEQVGAGATFDPLPELTEAALPIEVATSFFKAAQSKTFVRFLVSFDVLDVDLELMEDADEWVPTAVAWVRVAQDGQTLYQASRGGEEAPLRAQGERRLAEAGVPLRPGTYQWTALVVDRDGRGGKASGEIELPDLAEGLAMSSVVLATPENDTLPEAGEGAEGTPAPFQVGSYEVVPDVDATFSRGDTIAVVTQVYNAPSASLELDLWYEGSYQASLDPVELDRLPATEIQLITVVDAYPDGRYHFLLTAKGPDGATVERKVPFRIKG